jgi:CheY-like chemotaxis protein
MKQTRLGVLLVDDDDVDTEAIERCIGEYEHMGPLMVARNGIEALNILRRERPSLEYPFLILLDLNMPMMDGFEFLQEVRSDPELSSHVIFILTTSSDEADKHEAYKKHVAGYIIKNDLDEHGGSLFNLLNSYRQNNSFPSSPVKATSPQH